MSNPDARHADAIPGDRPGSHVPVTDGPADPTVADPSDHPGTTATLTRTAAGDLGPPPGVTADSRILRKVLDEMATRLPAEELLDSLAAFVAAAIGEGAVIWPAVGDPRLDGRPVVSHPDPAVRRDVRRALAGSSAHRAATTTDTVGRLQTDLTRAAGAAVVTPVRRGDHLLGHVAAFRTSPRDYGRGDRRLLERLADAGAAALEQITRDARSPEPAITRPRPSRPAAPTRQLPRQPGPIWSTTDRLAHIDDDERRSLADALTEEPIQRIASGLLTLEQLRGRLDDNARRVVDEVTGQLQDSLAWLRNLIVIALTPPDLADGLGRALGALARSIFAGTGTRVTVTGPNHVPLDPGAMETTYRIFREALTNVRRHAAAGSVTLQIDTHHDRVVLSLRDDGTGTARLTEAAHSRGIASMRARAENAGATLTILSDPHDGTTVSLTVTAQRRTAHPVPPFGPAVLTGQRTRRIVVCDDQQDLREAIRLVLTDVPRFRIVAEAGDGPTGLHQIRLHRPDLILLDVSMPGGGPDLARAAKDASPTSHIVVFSGRDDAATRDAMLAAGADQYVLKSGRLRLLLEALDNAG